MSKESKQILFDKIAAETRIEGITKQQVRNAFTSLNEEKMENDGSNLTDENIQDLQSVLGVNKNAPSRFIRVGQVATSGFIATVELYDDISNQWIIKNVNYESFTETEIEVDEIIDSENLRIDSIYANNENSFQVVKGVEAEAPTRPIVVDDNLLFLTDIIVTSEGLNVDQPIDLTGYKEKAEDNWKIEYPNKLSIYNIVYSDKRTCFSLEETTPSTSNKTLSFIEFLENTPRDIFFTIKNNSIGSVTISSVATDDLFKGFSANNTPLKILPKSSVLVKYSHEKDLIEIVNTLANVTGPVIGNGADVPLDVVPASASVRGTMSASHWSKLEGIDLSQYISISHPAYGISSTNITNWNTAYGWGNHASAGYVTNSSLATSLALKENTANKVSSWSGTTNNTRFPTEKLTKDTLDTKIDKVPGATIRFPQMNTDGSLSTLSTTTDVLTYVIGYNASGTPKQAETKKFKEVNTSGIEPTLSDLGAYTVDRVDYPTLNRIYYKVGIKWEYISLTEVV